MTTLRAEISVPAIDGVTVTNESLSVDLSDGRTLSVPLAWYPRLLHATPKERSNWHLIGDGEGIHWPDLDEDISAENLLLGSPSGETQGSFQRWLDQRKGRSQNRAIQDTATRKALSTNPTSLQFRRTPEAHNDCVIGYLNTWEYTLPGGGYDENRAFFWVHWQINIPKDEQAASPKTPEDVRLHVESPRESADRVLNNLKLRMIRALLSSQAEEMARSAGFEYQPGSRTSDAEVKRNKSTEAFRVVVDASQAKVTQEETIEHVHTIVGDAVDEVVRGFAEELSKRFRRSEA